MKKIIIGLLLSLFFNYSFSQESKEIELQYVTRVNLETRRSSRSMQWKIKEEENWKYLGKKFSLIEPTLNKYKESAKYLEIAKNYRKKYNTAFVATIVGSLTSGAVTYAIVAKNKNSLGTQNESVVGRWVPFIPFLVVATGGGFLIHKYKTVSYENLKLSCSEYNKKVNSDLGIVQSYKLGLGFSNIYQSSYQSRNFAPQLTLSIGLR